MNKSERATFFYMLAKIESLTEGCICLAGVKTLRNVLIIFSQINAEIC